MNNLVGKYVFPEKKEGKDFYFKTEKERLGHSIIVGSSGYGKTVSGQKYISSIVKDSVIGATILDFKDEWVEGLSGLDRNKIDKFIVVEEKRGVSYSKQILFRYNPIRVPRNIQPYVWTMVLSQQLTLNFGLGQKAYEVILRNITNLYRLNNVFEEKSKSNKLSLLHLYQIIKEERKSRKLGHIEEENYERILNRFKVFLDGDLNRMELNKVLSVTDENLDIEDFIVENKVVIVEGLSVPSPIKSFLYAIISVGILLYRQNLYTENASLPEHLLVIEDLDLVFKSNLLPDESLTTYVEDLWKEGMKYKLYLVGMSQRPSLLSPTILGNTNTYIVHRLSLAKEIDTLPSSIKDCQTGVLYIDRLPVGHAFVQIPNYTFQNTDNISIVKFNK